MQETDATQGWYSRPTARAWVDTSGPSDARAFHEGLPAYAPTPLVSVPDLAAELGVGAFLVKDESSRLGLPAFKVLGASWAVARVVAGLTGATTDLPSLRRAAAGSGLRLVTATDGNHGRAVAHMAAMLGLAATVFVPEVISPAAAEAIAGEGADVVRTNTEYDAAVVAAAEFAAEHPDRQLVQDTAWPGYEQVPAWIVEGYDTMLEEVDEQLGRVSLSGAVASVVQDVRWQGAGAKADCPSFERRQRRQRAFWAAPSRSGIGRHALGATPDLVAVPVGVGSLAQAVVSHYRRSTSHPALLSVEPDSAACMLASLAAGTPVTVTTQATVMAGLNCGTVSTSAWPVLHAGCDAAVSVSDAEALRAVEELGRYGVSSGPSGAASLAGVRAALAVPERRDSLDLDSRSTVVILSTEGAS